MKSYLRKVIGIAMIAIMVFALTACGGGNASDSSDSSDSEEAAPTAPTMSFQLGHVDPEDENGNIQYFALRFAEIVSEKSNGSIEIVVMPNSQLGGERDMLEGMQLGTVDMGIITNLAVSNFWPEYMVYDLPYLFKDVDAGLALMDSDIDAKINDNMYKEAGIKVLAKGDSGFRNTANNVRPISKPEDMKGMKIRVPETPMYMETFKALGASPTPMAWGEVFTGLSQGTIDGCEIPTPMMASNRIFEVCKYFSATGHFFSPVQLLMSGSAWDSLDADTQDLLLECAAEAAKMQRDYQKSSETDLRAMLEENGMECNDDVDIPAFQELCKPVYEMFRDDIGSDLMDEVLEFTGAN